MRYSHWGPLAVAVALSCQYLHAEAPVMGTHPCTLFFSGNSAQASSPGEGSD